MKNGNLVDWATDKVSTIDSKKMFKVIVPKTYPEQKKIVPECEIYFVYCPKCDKRVDGFPCKEKLCPW